MRVLVVLATTGHITSRLACNTSAPPLPWQLQLPHCVFLSLLTLSHLFFSLLPFVKRLVSLSLHLHPPPVFAFLLHYILCSFFVTLVQSFTLLCSRSSFADSFSCSLVPFPSFMRSFLSFSFSYFFPLSLGSFLLPLRASYLLLFHSLFLLFFFFVFCIF